MNPPRSFISISVVETRGYFNIHNKTVCFFTFFKNFNTSKLDSPLPLVNMKDKITQCAREIYLDEGCHESVYNNMPHFGLAKVGQHSIVNKKSNSTANRLRPQHNSVAKEK